MNITLRPETEKLITEKVSRGDFDSPDAIVEQAITFFLNYEVEEMEAQEFHEVQTAILEASQQADRGEGISLAEFDKMMRAKYGIER